MRIVITGNRGFVGQHTEAELVRRGYEVVGFDIQDGRDLRKIEDLTRVLQPGDKILHLAAIARFNEADKNPLLAFEVNVRGTQNLMEAAQLVGVDRVVYASTGSVYMPVEEVPIKEDFPIRGNSVYGCTKALAELTIMGLGVPYIILRYGHLYGGTKRRGAVGGFLTAMEEGRAPVLWGGKQTNDFTYIKDIVDANITALFSEALNEAYNIGTGVELSTEKVFKIMAKELKYDKKVERLPARQVDPVRFWYDVSKAENLLGFKAKWSFRAGLKDFIKRI